MSIDELNADFKFGKKQENEESNKEMALKKTKKFFEKESQL